MSKQENSVDLIYVEGPGDIVAALKSWYKREDFITETSKTFSGQVFDFSKNNHLSTLAISFNREKKHISFDRFSAYNFPKKSYTNGLSYHLSQLHSSLKIIKACVKHRPEYLHMTNGVTHLITLAPLKLLGIKITLQCHNTFWAKGYPPQSKGQKFWLKLDAWFLKNIASNVLCCSPEIKRQVAEMTKNPNYPSHVFKGQFYKRDFEAPPPPPKHASKPFTVAFAGRVESNKGVFDILEMAEQLKDQAVIFHICGGGSHFDRLNSSLISKKHLSNTVFIHGKLKRPDLLKIYNESHAVIVPTRSDFCEGLPLTAIEAILLGRPIITSSLSNALDVLGDAIAEAEPENINSYVAAIQSLANDTNTYQDKQAACHALRTQFLDGQEGLTAMMEKTL